MQELIELNLGITDVIEFERCHRISGQANFSKNQNRPWTIIFKVTKFEDRQKILKYAKCLKDTEIFIYEDFCVNRFCVLSMSKRILVTLKPFNSFNLKLEQLSCKKVLELVLVGNYYSDLFT